MARSEVAPGVHRFADEVVNWYLLEADDGAAVLVDAGFPGDYDDFQRELGDTGHALTDVRDVVITHAHIDHLGFADRVHRDAGATVHVPEGDADLARRPWKAARSARNPLLYALGESATRELFAVALRRNAIRAEFVTEFATYAPGDTLPGGLVAVGCPGHTLGHCALLQRERDVLLAGDALVTRDPYTGRTGPRLVARAATADVALAHASLDALEQTGARIVLTGHGEPWTDGAEAAATLARMAGSA